MDNDELIDALTFGNLQTVVRELQKDPSIINKKDKIGWTPLMVAASSMQYDLCKELIQTFKANVKLASEVDGNNVLHVLGDTRGLQKEQETKYISTWELILKHGGSLKSQNFEGETPIHLACLRNNISIIKFLLGKNALSEEIINKTNKTGSTAIHYASAYGRTEIVKLLINYGANINIKGEHGTSEDLAQKFKHKETADLLKRMRELNSYLLLVPQEIQVFIFQFLTPEDLCNVSKTCVQLNKTSSHDSIWKPFGNPKWAEEAKTIGWKGMYLRFLRTQISAYLNRENSKSTNKNNNNTKSNNSSNNNEPIKEYKKITQGRIDLNPPSRPTTPDKPNYDYLLKFLLVGDSGVGKTSLLLRFSDDTFTTSYLSTIGVDFKIRTIMIDDAYVKLQIWDTAGPERFRTITSAYYRGAHGILYDMTDKLSFDHVKHWLTEIEKYALPSTEIALVGTKKDITDKRVVTTEDAMQYLATLEKRIPIFVETSAKTGENISEVFSNLALAITSKLSSSPMLYLGGYCKMGWPNYVPSTQAIQRMVRQLPVDKENSNESNTQTTKSSCEIQ